MAPDDPLAIAFPRIDPALLWGPGRAARSVYRRLFSASPLYLERPVALPQGGHLTVHLFGPERCRWLRALALARRCPQEGARRFSIALAGLSIGSEPPAGELWTPRFLRDRWRQAGVIPYHHQMATARRVLFQLGGRALLADEVGLGKTVEAGLILHELLLRRLACRVLILVPSGLCWQWYRELRDKFDLPVELQGSQRDWQRVPLLIASLDTAKRPPHRDEVLARPYDLVIVDEAHRLKNERTRAYGLVAAIRTRYLLLVTATPVHNHLGELWSLLKLLAPQDVPPSLPRNLAPPQDAPSSRRLRRTVQRVMVRHRRSDTPVPFTRRHVHTVVVRPTQAERQLYAALDGYLVESSRPGGRADARSLVFLTLKRELCSSPHALAESLRRMVGRGEAAMAPILAQAEQAQRWAKAEAAVRLVRRLGNEHVLVFTEYVATQRALAHRLAALGRPVVLFHGGLSPMQRDWARSVFETEAPVMVSTDAGAEGVNLQFCRHVVNVELPWNPMRVEQRIGRLHRLGQRRDVHVWNLVAAGTIEEYVVYLLHRKLDLFRRFVGPLDAVVGGVGRLARLERQLTRLLARPERQADPADGIRRALQELADQWQRLLQGIGEAPTGHA